MLDLGKANWIREQFAKRIKDSDKYKDSGLWERIEALGDNEFRYMYALFKKRDYQMLTIKLKELTDANSQGGEEIPHQANVYRE